MTISKRDVFEALEPPPGGVARLRTRLESARRRPGAPRALLPMTAAAAAATLLTVWLGLGTRVERIYMVEPGTRPELAHMVDRHPATVGLGLDADPVEPVVVPPNAQRTCAVARVSAPGDEVIFYWVAPAEAPETTH